MRREVVVNGRFLSRQVTGVERYGREILSLIGSNCRVESTRANGLAGHAWEQFSLPAKLKPGSVLWSPANTGPLSVRDQAVTIHDLSPIEHPEWFKAGFARWYRLFLPILIKRVRIVFTPSDFVKQKVTRRFGVGNVIVTPNGVDTSRFCPGARQSTVELPENFVLFVGSLQPRKNLRILLQAWGQIRDGLMDTWLVIAGDSGTVFAKTILNVPDRVIFLGYPDDNDLPGIYAQAKAFVLPSLDEGFGLPAIEAMACGVPVIVSTGGALPETVGEAALMFDPADSDELSMTIKNCLKDNHLRSTLVARGFDRVQRFKWQPTAETIWKALNEE